MRFTFLEFFLFFGVYQLADKHVAVVLVFLHVPTFNIGFVKDQCFTKHAIHCFYVTCVPIVQGLVEREGAIETILHVGYIFSAPIIDGLIEYFCPKKQSFEVRTIAHVPRMNGFVERFVVDKDLRKILDERDIEIVDLAVRSVAFLLINFYPLDQLLSRLRLVGRSVTYRVGRGHDRL